MEDNEYELLLVNAVTISRLISDELKEDASYNNVVKIADELKLTPYQVTQFMQLHKKVQQYMLL